MRTASVSLLQNPCFLCLLSCHLCKSHKKFFLKFQNNLSSVSDKFSLQMNVFALFGKKIKSLLLNTFISLLSAACKQSGNCWCPLVIISPSTWTSVFIPNYFLLFQLVFWKTGTNAGKSYLN